MSTESLFDVAIPPHEKGWRYEIPPPPVFEPGQMPYPVILVGPRTMGERDLRGKVWQLTTNTYKVITGKSGKQIEVLCQHLSKGDHNYGPFGDGLAIFIDLSVHDEGVYRFEHIGSLADSVEGTVMRHVFFKSFKHEVKRSFKNSSLRLTEEQTKYVKGLFEEYPFLENDFKPYLYTKH